MKQLHAPWRIQFVEGEAGTASRQCVLCSMAAVADAKSVQIVEKGTYCYVVMNKYPYSNGHLMIVPYAHESGLERLTPETGVELFKFSQRAVQVLAQVLAPQGFNFGMNIGKAAGAGIEDHLHLHIVPRWVGDTNFMPVLGDVKVIPEHLEVTYDRIFKSWSQS